MWDADTASPSPPSRGTPGVQTAAFSPDGKRVVTASVTRRRGCGTPTPAEPLATLQGPHGLGHSAAFSPDGKRVVTASEDDTARLWDADTGAAARHPQGAHRRGLQRRVQPRRQAACHRL